MQVHTREFGDIEVTEQDIIRFVRPIYGFEELTDFVLITDDEVGMQFAWLQSLQDANICFILVNPQVMRKDYNPVITKDISDTIMCSQDVVAWCIAIVAEDFTKSTANLKSPILMNPHRKIAMQAILDEDYPIRETILAGEERGA